MLRLLAVAGMVAALSACSMFQAPQGASPSLPVAVAPGAPQLVDANGVPIERIGFRPGVSTVTVENMAKLRACTGGAGAGLVTEPGPVEVYRMRCDNGKVFMARCELRQCKPM
jgi:hypothetical protein